MTTVTHTFSGGGRLGNKLYYALQTNIAQAKNPAERHVFFTGDIDSLSRLGLSSLVTNSKEGAIINTCSYCQHVGVDFTVRQAKDFIAKHILPSESARNAREYINNIDQNSCMAMHLRNTDYLRHGHRYHCFDRMRYLSVAVKQDMYRDVNTAYIFSDDISFSKFQYGNLLKDRFSTVIYVDQGPAEYDLLKLALFRNKIIMNSTFGVWASFIGSVFYEDSEPFITAPAITRGDDLTTSIYNPDWTLLPIIRLV